MALIKVGSYEPKHLSFSTVNGYRGCGKRFELEKVMHLEQRPMLAGIGGNAIHSVSERIDEYILEHGFDAVAPVLAPELDSTTESIDADPAPF